MYFPQVPDQAVVSHVNVETFWAAYRIGLAGIGGSPSYPMDFQHVVLEASLLGKRGIARLAREFALGTVHELDMPMQAGSP